jgi:hypothetical protein
MPLRFLDAFSFRRSVLLRRAPTHRQARAIIARLEEELTARGAAVEARGSDALSFRTPYPWRATRPSWLLAASGGEALVTAGGGGPWRVRFDLHFGRLRALCLLASAALILVGLDWPRLVLINALVGVWGIGYALVGVIALSRLRRLVRSASRDVAERRRMSRGGADAATATGDAMAVTGEGPRLTDGAERTGERRASETEIAEPGMPRDTGREEEGSGERRGEWRARRGSGPPPD